MRKFLHSQKYTNKSIFETLVYRRANRIIVTLIILSCTFLLYQYREGGVKDTGITSTSIRDVGGYITTGLMILEKVNPYIPDGTLWSGARWGTFGTIPVALVAELIPRFLQVLFFQVVGLLGVYFFINIILRNSSIVLKNSIFLLLVWSSAYREMLTTNQIIGMILGLIAVGIRYLFLEQKRKSTIVRQVLGILCFVIALDLKPHISGLFIVGLYIYYRQIIGFLKLLGMYLITHGAVDVYLGRVTEIDWLKIINELNDNANRNALGDSVTFWPVVRRLVDIDDGFGLISKITLLILILLTFTLAYKRKWQLFIFLSFFAPSFSIYFHYYDAVPFLILVIWAILSRPKSVFSFIVLDFLLISKEFLSPRNMLLVLVISAVVAICSSTLNTDRKRNLVFSIIGFVIWQFIGRLNLISNSNQFDLHSLVVTQVLILSALYFIKFHGGTSEMKGLIKI